MSKANKQTKTTKTKSPSFLDWLIKGVGTVSEPWPTIEELLDDDDVKNEIKEAEEAIKERKRAQAKKTDSA